MKLWLDSNISLDLTRNAIESVEIILRRHARVRSDPNGEIENAANIIRAHLQHVLEEPGLELTDQELLS